MVYEPSGENWQYEPYDELELELCDEEPDSKSVEMDGSGGSGVCFGDGRLRVLVDFWKM